VELFQAVVSLARSIAAERPLMIVVDDLQWAEPSTVLLLAHLVRHAPTHTAVLATMRRTETGTSPAGLLGHLGSDGTIDVIDRDGLDLDEVGRIRRVTGWLPSTERAVGSAAKTDGRQSVLPCRAA
jgi:hypothetical protein